MKFSRFCCYQPHITALTKKEIEVPYLVLDELYRKRSMEEFQKMLWAFQKTIFKEGDWKNHNPADLYILCCDLIRLTDCLWLINKYSPELSSPLNTAEAKDPDSKLTINLNMLSPNLKNKGLGEVSSKGKTVLANFFNNHYTGFNRSDIYCFLQLGLDASYMQNNKYKFFSLGDSKLATVFYYLSEIIAEGYKIHKKGINALPKLLSCKEVKFASDSNHPTVLSRECIGSPNSVVESFFNYYLNFDAMQQGLYAWERTFYEKDFWKKAESPGNLVYLQERLLILIDSIWLLNRKRGIEKYINRYQPNAEDLALAKNCSPEEQANPFLVLQSFFAFKKMHQWKTLIRKWLIYSLNNLEEPNPKDRRKIELAHKHLLKFIEATRLLFRTNQN